jgi:hypothetical protein
MIRETRRRGRPKHKKKKEFMSTRLFRVAKKSTKRCKPRGVPDTDCSESSCEEADLVDILGENRASVLMSLIQKKLKNLTRSKRPQSTKKKIPRKNTTTDVADVLGNVDVLDLDSISELDSSHDDDDDDDDDGDKRCRIKKTEEHIQFSELKEKEN